VALLESAAVDAVAGHLEAGMTTVGVHVDVRHLAATPVGMAVHAEATLLVVDGRSLTFRVSAHDARELVAEGTHRRFIVHRERFLQRAMAKAGSL
jgi:predicted thioesterase